MFLLYMTSHLGDVGFRVKDQTEYKHLVKLVVQKGIVKKVNKKHYTYHCYNPNDNIQMWVLLKKNEFYDFTPYYEGKSKFHIIVDEKIIQHDGLDTLISCRILEENSKDYEGIPTIFDIPNYWLVNSLIKIKKRYEVKLTAFAEYALFYKNKKAFSKKKKKFASDYYIPAGTFRDVNKERNPKGEPQATAMFAGKIKELKLIENKETKQRFYWMIVTTLIGDIDVVCEKKLFPNKPKVNGILDGFYYIIGTFDLNIKKQTFFNKILGR